MVWACARLCFVFDDLVNMARCRPAGGVSRRGPRHLVTRTGRRGRAGAGQGAGGPCIGGCEPAATSSRPPRPVPAFRFRSGPGRDHRTPAPALRSRSDQPAGAERARRGTRLGRARASCPWRIPSRARGPRHSAEDLPMRKSRRRHRALRAALGLAIILALGFAADAIVLVTTHAHADAADAAPRRGGNRPPLAPGGGERRSNPFSRRVRGRDCDKTTRRGRGRRSSAAWQKGLAADGSDPWSLAMIGVTLALAVFGGIVVAGRRFLPQPAGAGMQVVGRVSLSPKHTVYMLRVGRRVLLIGAGPQGSPSLISELDDLAEIDGRAAPGRTAMKRRRESHPDAVQAFRLERPFLRRCRAEGEGLLSSDFTTGGTKARVRVAHYREHSPTATLGPDNCRACVLHPRSNPSGEARNELACGHTAARSQCFLRVSVAAWSADEQASRGS